MIKNVLNFLLVSVYHHNIYILRVLIKDAVSYKAALTNDPEEMLGVLNYFSSNMSHLFNYTINELQSVQGNTGFQASALPDYKKMKIRFKHM